MEIVEKIPNVTLIERYRISVSNFFAIKIFSFFEFLNLIILNSYGWTQRLTSRSVSLTIKEQQLKGRLLVK